MTTSQSGFCRSEPTLPRKTFGAIPIEQVRHSPTYSRKARFTFTASSRATGTCRSVPYQLAGHLVDRAHLFDRQAGVDRLQDALVILGVEAVISLHRNDIRAQLPRIAHERAGLDASSAAWHREVEGGAAAGVSVTRLRPS
jgi:hypothetical protein